MGYKPPRCNECEYWRKRELKYKNRVVGECRANTPQMGPDGIGYWPLTYFNNFCYKGSNGNSVLLSESEMKELFDDSKFAQEPSCKTDEKDAV